MCFQIRFQQQKKKMHRGVLILMVILPIAVVLQECPEQRPAPQSGVLTRPYPGVLINNIQWVHVPVLVNLTAWSPDVDEQCKGESMTGMYKDLLTTAFLKYHSAVTTRASMDQSAEMLQTPHPTGVPPRRKLLGFMDSILGATGTGLGISNWIDAQQLRKNELHLKELVGAQVLQTDAYLQAGLREEKETVQDIHSIASVLSIISQNTKRAFNRMQKELYCAQFASIKYQEISHILQEVLAGKVPATLFTEEIIMKWFGMKNCFNSASDNLKTFMNNLGRCRLPLPYNYILQMARVSSHPLPAGFYSPFDYGPLMEGIHLPFSSQWKGPSTPTNRIPPIQILEWWNETLVNNPDDKSWACSAGNSLNQFGCFMRQMYAMLLTVSLPIFQTEQVFEKIVQVDSLGVLQENVLKERKDLPKFITQLPSGEWKGLSTECCERTPFGFFCECDALEKQPLCGIPQKDDTVCEVHLTHIHNNFTRVVVLGQKACITTTQSHFSIAINDSMQLCPVNSTSFCITPSSSWSIGNFHFPYVNMSQQTMYAKPEEELGFVETIPEFDYELPLLDKVLMSLMQRKDNHIIKMQQELEKKDKALIHQMHDGDLDIAFSGLVWELSFKIAVCICIILILCQCVMMYCMCSILKRHIANSSVSFRQSRWR